MGETVMRFDVVIIGAGLAGSTCAILLARAGWSVALVEKQTFPRRKVCGECVAASNLPLLDALGIGASFAASAGPALREMALMQGDKLVRAPLPAAADPAHPWGRGLGRETLDTLLLEQARVSGATVFQPWLVHALESGEAEHRCTLRAAGSSEQRFLSAPVVIDAHGSWEPLPSERDARRQARHPGNLLAFKANFVGAHLEEGLLPVLSFTGGYGGMVVADHGVTTLACCIREDQLEACRRASPGVSAGEAVEAYLKHECAGVARALATAQREGPWLAAGPIQPGIRLRKPSRVFRVGNAAAEAHPIIGEGMSMAIQSAWLLCGHLLQPCEERSTAVQGAWQQGIHQRYTAEWLRHFAPRFRLAATFAQLAMRPKLAAPAFALVRHWPGLLTQGAHWGGKVRCAVSPAVVAGLAKPRTRQLAPKEGTA